METLCISSEELLAAVSRPALLPIRILAGLALVAAVLAFVYVLRHLKQIEQTLVKDDLVPEQRGARNNAVLMICAIPVVVLTLLVFLLLKG